MLNSSPVCRHENPTTAREFSNVYKLVRSIDYFDLKNRVAELETTVVSLESDVATLKSKVTTLEATVVSLGLIVSTTAPSSPVVGTRWYNPSTGTRKEYTGSKWIQLYPAALG